jgi:predicted phage terminase large subunit-like protein
MSTVMQREQEEIRPQPGPQEMFLSTSADIAVYGGSAGGGKTFALLMEPLRHVDNAKFGAVTFRRTYPEIKNEGGLWDEASNIYPLVGAKPRETTLEWEFNSGAKVKFAHMQLEKDKYSWQGSQVPLICWDELTHFSASQFFYMLSRNRSTCGIKPYIRATTNPDADSWVKDFLAPWIDATFPNPAESGEIRWFIRDGGQIIWCKPSTPDAKSVTFIRSSIYDNKILLEKNPEYLANLKALPLVERMRLLDGDWSIRPSGNKFKRHWFGEPIAVPPADMDAIVRYWDLAATEPKDGSDPDYTAGVKVGRKNDMYYVLDVQRERATPGAVENLIKAIAAQDGVDTLIVMEQEPGSSGVNTISTYRRLLAGYQFKANKTTGKKELRANIASSQAEGGNIKIVKSYWNNDFLNELSAFPMKDVHDDQVDAFSGAMEKIIKLGRAGGMIIDAEPAKQQQEQQQQYEEEDELAWR